MTLGEKIIYLRKEKGLTQEKLAQELGITRQVIHKWETDKTLPPVKRIIEMCDIFGVDRSYFSEELTIPASTPDTVETPIPPKETIVYITQEKKKDYRKGIIAFSILLAFFIFVTVCVGMMSIPTISGDSMGTTLYVDKGVFYISMFITLIFLGLDITSIVLHVKDKKRRKSL